MTATWLVSTEPNPTPTTAHRASASADRAIVRHVDASSRNVGLPSSGQHGRAGADGGERADDAVDEPEDGGRDDLRGHAAPCGAARRAGSA